MAINIKPANKGKLHAKLGVPMGSPIPSDKLAKAKDSKSPALRKEATFAENAKGFKHTGNKPKTQTKTPVKTDRGNFSIKG